MAAKLICGAFVFLVTTQFFVEAQYVNLTEHPGELCDSECVKGENRICYFKWTLELYHAMGPACRQCEIGVDSDCDRPQCIVGDLHQKGVMSINRRIPGPEIIVCEGDFVVVDVENKASGVASTIHWHGLHMVETPYMDGVPYATQCPIAFGTSFQYQFYATEAGTHFYHSHAGQHKLNGIYGAIIVRRPDEDNQHYIEYDIDESEHYILVSDWKHGYGENSEPGLPRGESFPDALLINGRGTFVDRKTNQTNRVPVTVYYVEPGKRYKFNLINSLSLTEIVQLQIEKHPMTVIATDSSAVEPLKVDTLISNSGERYEFVIETNQTEGDYWVRVRGLNDDQPQPTDSFALLRYLTKDSDRNKPQPPFPAYNETFPIGDRLNHPDAVCFDDDGDYCAADLTCLEEFEDEELVTSEPDYKFVFSFYMNDFPVEEGFIPGKYVRFDNPLGDVIANGVINNMSLILPPEPILTQYSDVDKSLFCEKSYCPEKCEGKKVRECVHVQRVKTDSIVEMVIHDEVIVRDLHHPFHLHGFDFAVIGMSNNSTNLTQSIEEASQYRKSRSVKKDTISIPTNGLAVLRFRASNPGVWLMHCHYDLHLATGMGMVFLVGDPDEWVQAPKHFPKCGNYLPKIKEDSI